MPTRNIVLADHQSSFLAKLVSSGRYQNASEVMRESLRLVELQEKECQIYLEALREAARVGIADIEAGRFRAFNTLGLLRSHLATLAETVLAEESPATNSEQ